jgi:hypothetical protein
MKQASDLGIDLTDPHVKEMLRALGNVEGEIDDEKIDEIMYEQELERNLHTAEVIIDGIRQVSIVEMILEKYPDSDLVWLEVPTEERKRRYESRGDAKDVEPFDVADNKPIELECQEIYSTFKDKITIINNYEVNYKMQ